MTMIFKMSDEELEFPGKGMELDPAQAEQLAKMQEEHRKKFKDMDEPTAKGMLEEYKIRVKALEEKRDQIVKRYDDEIKSFKELIASYEKKDKEKKPKTRKTKKKPDKK